MAFRLSTSILALMLTTALYADEWECQYYEPRQDNIVEDERATAWPGKKEDAFYDGLTGG